MKKTLIAGMAVILVAVVASVVMAMDHGAGMGHNHSAVSSTTPEQAQKLAQYEKEIVPLKQKMIQLRADLMVLRTAEKPDWKAIAEKQKAMVDVRIEMQKKAAEAGISGAGMGCGCGMDGMGMKGKGRMPMGGMGM